MNQERATQISLLLLRLVVGLMFAQHGGMKLLGWFGGMPSGVEMTAEVWIAGILELVGGALIFLGAFTRPVAFVQSGLMAVAYFKAHQPKGFWPIENHGELAVLYCFIFLFLAAFGGGEWSVDGMVRRKRESQMG